MKTYTTKIAKNGATLYYSVETGKRIAKEIALEIERKEIIANGTVKERYELAKEFYNVTRYGGIETIGTCRISVPHGKSINHIVGGYTTKSRVQWHTISNSAAKIDLKREYNLTIDEFRAAALADKGFTAEQISQLLALRDDNETRLALTFSKMCEAFEVENATVETKSEEDTEMKNQNTNAVSTPAIETRIASNGAVSVYVNGKRTSREEAIEIAEENNLPTYTAICYPYSERNYSISEEFATALSAYKWIVSKANSNRNVADGSFEIRRYTDGIKNETTIFDYTENGDEKINADDEPEFATFIYAEIGEVHISERYDRMVLFHNQLANDGLTEEQINQVLVTQYNNENGREHCNLIKEFKAQNAAIEAEIENAAQITESEPETISTDERIAEIENEIAPLVEEMKVVATDLQMFKEYPDEYTQEFIDERENLYDSLSRKYRKLVGELESLQKTPPENPAPESAETHAEPEEITFIAQNGASLTIEGGMPTIAANGNRLEVNGIWLGDYYTNEDAQEAAEALKIDVEEFGDDHPVLNKEYFAEIEFEESPTGGDRTAEHLNANAPEGWTVTRADKKINVDYHGKRVAEVDRITERDLLVPHAFFQQFQPLVDKSKTPEQIFLDDRYRELAELEEMREELQHTSPISKERLKTLDDMINQVKRDIYETEMDNPDTVASFCKAGAIDEDGNVWF